MTESTTLKNGPVMSRETMGSSDANSNSVRATFKPHLIRGSAPSISRDNSSTYWRAHTSFEVARIQGV